MLTKWPGYVALSLLAWSLLWSQTHQRCSWYLLLPALPVGNRAYVPTKRVLFVLPSSKFAGSSIHLAGSWSKPRFFGSNFFAFGGWMGFEPPRPPGSPGAGLPDHAADRIRHGLEPPSASSASSSFARLALISLTQLGSGLLVLKYSCVFL